MASVSHRKMLKPSRLNKGSLVDFLALALAGFESSDQFSARIELKATHGDATVTAESTDDLMLALRSFSAITSLSIDCSSWHRTPHSPARHLWVQLGDSEGSVSAASTDEDWASATVNRLAHFLAARRPWYWPLTKWRVSLVPLVAALGLAVLASTLEMTRSTRLVLLVEIGVLYLTSNVLLMLSPKLIPHFKTYLDPGGRSDNMASVGLVMGALGLIVPIIWSLTVGK